MRRRSSVFTFQMNSARTVKMLSLLIDFFFRCFKWCFQINWLFIITTRYLHLEKRAIWWSKILRIIFESDEAKKRLKWMSSYLIETKSESCWWAQIMHDSTCIVFSDRTFFSIEFLITRISMSSMKFAAIMSVCELMHQSIKFAL